MFTVMAKLLMNKQVKFSEGRLELMGIRDCFTPTITYIEIQRALTKSNSQYLIYNCAKKSGYNWFKNMSKIYKGMKQTEAIRWGMDIVSLSGWGIPSLDKLDLESKISIFNIKNSTTAKLYGPSSIPVDHLFRGLVAGGVSYILNDDLDCVETHCLANGNGLCRFIVAPIKTFKLKKEILERDFGVKNSN